MSSRFACVAVLIAGLAASAAMAQTTPAAQPPAPAPASGSTTVQSLTVRAAPMKHAEVEKKSLAFVQTYAAPTTVLDQYARWRDPVCVLVVGLPPDQAAMVKSRVEDVAQAVGLKLEKPGCKANIQIIFSAHPQNLLDWVAKRSDWLLGYHYPIQTQALKTVTRPVQGWYMTATRGGGANNAELAFMNVDSLGSDPGTMGLPFATNYSMESIDSPNTPPPNGCGDSRFSTCRSSLFFNAMVVVDTGRVAGKPLGPLADYVTMLALSQTKSPDGCLALPSILDLLAPACAGRDAPDGLTPADAAYLTALYDADPEAKKSGQQSEIAERMARIVMNAGAPVHAASEKSQAKSPGASLPRGDGR